MLLAVVVNRMAMALVTLAGVAVVIFILLRVVPGDPVAMMISPGASAADIAALKAHYGLDAWLARTTAGGILAMAFLFAVISSVGDILQITQGLPFAVVNILMAVILFIVLGRRPARSTGR